MLLEVFFVNELPFVIDMNDGEYEVKVMNRFIKLIINSEWYKLSINQSIFYGEKAELYNIIDCKKLKYYELSKCKTIVTYKISEKYEIVEGDINTITENNIHEELYLN